MTLDIDAIEPRRCPICDAGVLEKWASPTGLSHFVKFTCGFEMRDQHEARPRGWKPRFGSTCRNIDAQSLWSLRRAVDQSAEDFNAEAVARLKAEAEVRELRAALEAAKSQREAYKLSVYELREQLRHSVSEDALASAQDDLAGCRAALERARALVGELEWCGVDNWLECPWCLGTKAEHYGEPAGHKPDCKLAAFLAAASGGAV